MIYIDDYPTCDSTYVTLRIYTGDIDPEFVTQILKIQPSDILVKGKVAAGRKSPAILNGWFLCSEGQVLSKDSRRHIDWLLDQLLGKEEQLRTVSENIKEMYVSCYWSSESGHGGPRISLHQMKGLLNFGLELDHDIYI